MGTRIQQALGVGVPLLPVFPPPIISNRAPVNGRDVSFPQGQTWWFNDQTAGTSVEYTYDGSSDWVLGGNDEATTTSFGIVQLATFAELQGGSAPAGAYVPTANDVATVIAGVVVGAVPPATETQAGIAKIATQGETNTGTDDTRIVTPLKLKTVLGNGSVPGSFTDLTATGTISFTGATGTGFDITAASASTVDVSGAGIDLTLASAAGRVVVNGEEAAADAVRVLSAAGGLDVDVALQMNLASSQNAVDAIRIVASAGGIDIDAVGAATEDINITNTGGSIVLQATESAVDSIDIISTTGGIRLRATGAAATEDISLTATGSSIVLSATEAVSDAINIDATAGGIDVDAVGQINIATSQSAADSIVIESTAGGIDILASGASAGEDIDIIATGSSVNISATENAALAITLNTNGGTSETIRIRNQQGTNAASVDISSTAGGLTLAGGLGTADAVNITASTAGGGIDIDSSTGGFDVLTTGAISLDSAAASNFTVTGAFDLSLISSLGSVNVTAGEDAADAIVISAGAGGIDILATGAAGQDIDIANTGGSVNITATENDAGAITIGTNGGTSERITVTAAQGTNAASIGLTSTAGGITLTAGLGTADAINIVASNAAGGIDVDAGSAGVIVDTSTGAISLDSGLASNFTVTGAADLTLASSAGAVNVTSGEANADSINVTSAGGMNIVATGAAAKDTIITNTNGSVTITAGENVTDAFNLTASGAASRMNLTAGTGSVRLLSGLVVPVTTKATADTPYTVLGTDYFISCDTSGGVLQVTLPDATALAGRTFVIRDTNGSAAINNITIATAGGNLVGGGSAAATKVLSAAYSGATVYSNGTTWNYCYVA